MWWADAASTSGLSIFNKQPPALMVFYYFPLFMAFTGTSAPPINRSDEWMNETHTKTFKEKPKNQIWLKSNACDHLMMRRRLILEIKMNANRDNTETTEFLFHFPTDICWWVDDLTVQLCICQPPLYTPSVSCVHHRHHDSRTIGFCASWRGYSFPWWGELSWIDCTSQFLRFSGLGVHGANSFAQCVWVASTFLEKIAI